jgi:hypothetical protein
MKKQRILEVTKVNKPYLYWGGFSMAIKKITNCFAIILLFSFLVIGSDNHSPFVTEMELTSNYDNTDPFVIEQPFCVSDDVDSLDFEAHLQMRSETCLLEIADNETKEVMIEVFLSEGFNDSGEDKEYITLVNLDKDKEYVIRLTCTEVEHVKLVITSDSNLVQLTGMIF